MLLITCIIQARRQSERLPDKTLLQLGNRRVLEHVIARCKRIPSVSQVIVAAPEDPFEDAIQDVATGAGATCFRGDMHDVLSRFYYAAKQAKADYIIRVTADCPLLDPGVCQSLVEKLFSEQADYGATASWPHGLDCEVFSWSLLEQAHEQAVAKADREHVTLWMKRQKDINFVSHVPDSGDLYVGNRWVLDYPQDYEFLTALFEILPADPDALSWQDILAIIDQHPELRALNEKCAHDWGKKNEKIYQSVGHYWKSPS